jgi:hypothetical protein
MMIVRRTCKAVFGFALGVAFGVVLALVMPLAMAGEAWREGGEK